MANVGYATLGIIPSTKGFAGALSKGVNPAATASGASAGTAMGGSMKTGILGSLKSIAGPMAAIFGAGAIFGTLKSAVNEASNLGESVNAVQVVFKGAAGGILELGSNAAKAVGLSKTEFNGLAVQFSNFAQTVAGPGGDVVSTMSDLTTRASDFASVMNLDVKDAASLFQSGLAGNAEGLRAYGIDLSAAAVENYALANGIGDGTAKLTEAEKVQARYGLLMAATSVTQGDFANTSDSLANRQRILSSQWKNAKATLGGALVPVMSSALGVILSLFDGTSKLGGGLKNIAGAFKGLYDIFAKGDFTGGFEFLGIFEDSPIIGTLFSIREAFISAFGYVRDNVVPILQTVGSFIADNIVPIMSILGGILGGVVLSAVAGLAASIGGALVGGLVALVGVLASPIVLFGLLVGAVVYAYTHFETFRSIIDGVLSFITGTAVPAIISFAKSVMEEISKAVAFVKEIWPQVKTVIGGVLDAVTAIAKVFISVISAAWKAWGDDILQAVKAAFNFIKETISNVLDLIKGIIKTVLSVLTGDWKGAWDGIKMILSAVWDQMFNIIDLAWEAIKTVFGVALSLIKGIFSTAWTEITTSLSNAWTEMTGLVDRGWEGIKTATSTALALVVGFVAALPGEIIGALSALAGMLSTAASSAWTSFQGAVSTGVSGTLTFLGGVPASAVSAIGDLGSLLVGAGGDLLRGMANGIKGAVKGVVDAAVGAAKAVVNGVKSALGIASPSKVFAELGAFTGEGFAIGIASMENTAQKAMAAMVAPPSVSDIEAKYGASGTFAGGSAAQGATLADVVAEVSSLKDEIRRQTDRGVLMTRKGVIR